MSPGITRKEFLNRLALGSAALLFASGFPDPAGAAEEAKDIRGAVFKRDAPSKPWKWSIEAFEYAKDGVNVQCPVCPNRCHLAPGDRSICRSRVNIGGRLFSLAYGNPCSVHVDPIEKKPLYHFHPETPIFSIATAGCNFRCLNCQNWEISQKKPEEVSTTELFPEQVVEAAIRRNCPSIAYTYSEPTTFYEYMFHTAKRAREKGLRNVLVSNGYINTEPLRKLARFLDGANINLKSFEEKTYRSLNGGSLQPVLDTLKVLHEEGVWLEITTLAVPTYVEDPEMVRRMCGWILKELGPDHPLHLLRFFPQYRLTRLPPTPISTLEALREVALKEGIRYCYLGNVPGHAGSHTRCHGCGRVVVERKGFVLDRTNMDAGKCRSCGTEIPGRWADGPVRV
jgi:pyruvate formate lyase activating enzyme